MLEILYLNKKGKKIYIYKIKRADKALEHRCSVFVECEVSSFIFFLRTATLVFFRFALCKISEDECGHPLFLVEGRGSKRRRIKR